MKMIIKRRAKFDDGDRDQKNRRNFFWGNSLFGLLLCASLSEMELTIGGNLEQKLSD